MTSSEHSPQPEAQRSVVVMDDNANVRQMLALALETAGFAVFEAGTEIDLQRHLVHTRPDALLIDMQRSEGQGLKLLSRMRARATLRAVPIVFLAGSDAEDFREQALRAGADWFGLRPLGMIELQNRVTELVRSGRRLEQPTKRRKAASVGHLERTG